MITFIHNFLKMNLFSCPGIHQVQVHQCAVTAWLLTVFNKSFLGCQKRVLIPTNEKFHARLQQPLHLIRLIFTTLYMTVYDWILSSGVTVATMFELQYEHCTALKNDPTIASNYIINSSTNSMQDCKEHMPHMQWRAAKQGEEIWSA